jgi:vacuolar-type H+-ATPase subunit H
MTRDVVETDKNGRPAVVAVEETQEERSQRLERASTEAAERLALTRSQADRLRRAK